jgi:hypothetical protein
MRGHGRRKARQPLLPTLRAVAPTKLTLAGLRLEFAQVTLQATPGASDGCRSLVAFHRSVIVRQAHDYVQRRWGDADRDVDGQT